MTSTTKHLITSIWLTIVILSFGTAGYMIIEGWGILDAVYMTVITISTVGYGEVHEISKIGRVFTLFLVFAGIGFCIYVAGSVVQSCECNIERFGYQAELQSDNNCDKKI